GRRGQQFARRDVSISARRTAVGGCDRTGGAGNDGRATIGRMTMDPAWDVVVIGAGAAGLVAAIRAAELGRRVLLLEKNRKPGVKILMSGGTRCNITHATDNRGIVEAYGPPGRFLYSALAALSVQDTIDFFE